MFFQYLISSGVNLPNESFFSLILCFLILFPSVWKWKGFHEETLGKEHTNILRGIFAFCIMGGHISLYWNAHFESSSITSFWMTIGTWSAAVFFFLSGYGLAVQNNTRANYLQGFLKKRFLKILFPAITILLIYYLVLGHCAPIWDILKDYPQKNPLNSNSWFIWAILYFYFIFWLSGRWISSLPVSFVLLLLGTVFYAGLLDLVLHFSGWWFYSCILFPIGVAWGYWGRCLEPVVKKYFWALLPIVWLGFGILYLRILPSVFLPYILVMWLTSICWVLGVLLVGMKFQSRGRFWQFLGKISLELYLIHGLWLTVCDRPFLWSHPWAFPVSVCGLSIVSAAVFHKVFNPN